LVSADLITAFQQDRTQSQSSTQSGAGQQADTKATMGANDSAADGTCGSWSNNLLRLVYRIQRPVVAMGANVFGAGDALQHALDRHHKIAGEDQRCEAKAELCN